MSRGWLPSGLTPGETVRTNIPFDKHVISRAEYVLDFNGGILLRFYFGPNEERTYTRAVPYADVWDGDVKLWSEDGTEVRIKHKDQKIWAAFVPVNRRALA